MDEDIIRNAQLYASVKKLHLAERLGFGIHGIIFATERKTFPGNAAIKAHRAEEPYHRELAV